MHPIKCTALRYFFDKYSNDSVLRSLSDRMEAAKVTKTTKENESVEQLLEVYKESLPIIEKEIWNNSQGRDIFARYQELFREMEEIISISGQDDRHEFIVVIPVADRPQQLRSCLNSLLDLCKSYHYGGYANNKFSKVSVIIADDSKEEESRVKNRELSNYINDQGIDAFYFGLDEQLEELDSLSEREREKLSRIVGNKKRTAFYHKGPSIMRNIAYLKLNGLAEKKKNPLFYFVDSDQEFKVEVSTEDGDVGLSAINYFFELDRVFNQSKAEILTGKVVGDPPVSPSVMAGNFLEDVISFMHRMAEIEHDRSCQFHHVQSRVEDDAAYHDMADLFGFTPSKESYQYHCPIRGVHDNSACFINFIARLNRFFYGEHPTRNTRFSYEDVVGNSKPARTVYTGNYVFKPQALRYFVPFATLKLRMAGPVLGRIIKSEIKEKFIAANLPMLHRRTVQKTGQSEFRPGVNKSREAIDLSGEFERQYFGDVILFTIEKICDMGYPEQVFQRKFVEEMVTSTEIQLYEKYSTKHAKIVEKIKILESIMGNREVWWNRVSGLATSKESVELFMKNIESNFGANAIGYELISTERNKNNRKREIIDAIMAYSDDRSEWAKTFSNRLGNE